jgi:hypothetical protein
VARGVAYADIDNDGDLDLLVTTNGGPALLFRNDGVTNHSLRLKLEGVRSNRDGIGAVIRVIVGPEKWWLALHSGSSYLSQSELVLTVGLGQRTQADQIEVSWPSGETEYLTNVAAGQTVTVREGKGIVASRKFGATR